ncbi:MAG: multiubiquitin domain-containing protein [Pyrinomonadaceae bacterium]|nr:multiubiquitin domain-containing protein [Xanthobacteraceae bacterium]
MSNLEERGQDDPGEEQILDDVIDLEEYAKAGKQPPLAKGYRLRVNGEPYVVHEPVIKGREVLTLAGLLPPEEFTLRLKMIGGKPEKIGLDEKVDLRRKGVEKFKALPRDQTEG